MDDKKMRYLVLINKRFPYDKGEPFLENEMKEYRGKFDGTYVFPISVGREGKETRQTPDYVKVLLPNREGVKILQARNLLEAVGHAFTKATKESIVRNNYSVTLSNRIKHGYYTSIVKLETSRIKAALDKLGIKAGDEVIFYSYWFFTTAQIVINLRDMFIKKGVKAIAVSRAHRFDIYSKNQIYGIEMMEHINGVYPCSDNGADYLKAKYKGYADKIQTSYLGTTDHGLQNYTYSSEAFNIVSCSRITDIKRVERIASTLQYIDKECDLPRRIKWIHIGDGESREAIEKSCSGLRHVTCQFMGYLPNEKVYDYYLNHNVDLFVNVSSSEGLPVSIMEAISFGIPVIATDVGGTSEIAVEGYSGLLLKEDFTDEDFATKILTFTDMSEEKYVVYRRNARKLWEDKYNAAINYEEFINKMR